MVAHKVISDLWKSAIPHDGGVRPVHADSRPIVFFRINPKDPSKAMESGDPTTAKDLRWSHENSLSDIVAYIPDPAFETSDSFKRGYKQALVDVVELFRNAEANGHTVSEHDELRDQFIMLLDAKDIPHED